MNPKQSISILGCGWLGLPLAKELLDKGFEVKGSTTSSNKLDQLSKVGIDPFLVHIGDKTSSAKNFFNTEILVVCIPSKDVNNFKLVIKQIENAKIEKVIFVSSTSVYQNTNKVVTENSPTRSTELIQIENSFKNNTHFKTTILRFGGLIGYDRQPGTFHKEGKIIANPEGFVNLIHRVDCIQIIEQIIIKNIWNNTFNACMDSHPSRREFFTSERLKFTDSKTLFDEASISSYKIISSNKLKNSMAYNFIFDDLKNI